MTAVLVFAGRESLHDDDGIPRNGAKLFTYLTGTSTPLSTYTSSLLAVQHSNPVIADTNGTFPAIYANSDLGDIKLRFQDQNGVDLPGLDIDPYIMLPFDQAELQGILTPLQDAEAAVGVTNAILVQGPAQGDPRRYGAQLDGSTDDTAAFKYSLLQADQPDGAAPYWPRGTAVVSSLTVSAPKRIRTAGYATVLKQKSGLPSDTHILNIYSSDVEIDEFSAIGNIATDTQEFMHACVVGGSASISNITIHGIKGTNIRGDVLYLGGTIANPLYNVTVGDVNGTNIYRNVMSFVGVNGCEVNSITGTQNGYRLFDIEPNAGISQAPTGIHIRYVRGSNMQFAGDPSINIGTVRIDYADMDNALHFDSSPGYPTHPPSAGNLPIIANNFTSIRIGYLRGRAYLERLFNSTGNTVKGSFIADSVDISGCNTTEVIYKTLFNIDEKIDLRFNSGSISLTALDRYVVKGNAGPFGLNGLRINGGAIATQCTNGRFSSLTIDGGALASLLFANCIGCTFENIVATSTDAATLLTNSTGNTLDTASGIFATVEGSGCADNQMRHSTINGIAYAYDRLAGHIATQAMADANQTLTAQQSTTVSITTTGALTAQRNLVVPAIPRIYTVYNACTGAGIQVIGASGTGIVIASTKRAMIQYDGTNVVRLTADV